MEYPESAGVLVGDTLTHNDAKADGSNDLTSLAFLGKNGMMSMTPKPDNDTVRAYNSLPVAVRSAVDQTAAFQFRKHRFTSGPSQHRITKNAQCYIGLLQANAPQLMQKIPDLLGLKCSFCLQAMGSTHVKNSLSFVLMNEGDRTKSLKEVLRNRLDHILNDCPNAKQRFLVNTEEEQKFRQTYILDTDPSINEFLNCWINFVEQVYFSPDDAVTPQMVVHPEIPQPMQQMPAANGIAEMMSTTQQLPTDAPLSPTGAAAAAHTSASVRTIIDVQHIPPGITDGPERLSRDLDELYQTLPPAVRILLTTTSVCNFFERPATEADTHEKYSQGALKYMSGLERLCPQMAKDALSLTCFFCTNCGAQHKFVGLKDGLASASHVLSESLRLLMNHTPRCSQSKKALGKGKTDTVVGFNFGSSKPIISRFARLCLTHVLRVYFSGSPMKGKQVISLSLTEANKPLGFATVECEERQDRAKQKRQLLLQQQRDLQLQKNKQKLQELEQKIEVAASQTRPNGMATASAKPTKTSPPKKSKKRPTAAQLRELEDLKCIYDRELDYLECSMLVQCNSENENDFVAFHNIDSQAHSLPPLPFPKSDGNALIPLHLHDLVQSSRYLPYITEVPQGNVISCFDSHQEERPSKRLKAGTSSRQNPYSKVLLCQKLSRYDVVIPETGCSVTLAQDLYNMHGNRYFLVQVSKNRGEFTKLTTWEEKTALAKKVLDTIEICQRGVFYKAKGYTQDGFFTLLPYEKGNKALGGSTLNSEVLLYTIFRLEHGFQDVLSLPLVGPSFAVELALSPTIHNGSQSNKVDIQSKVMMVEHPPMLGLIHGEINWNVDCNIYLTRSKMYDAIIDASREIRAIKSAAKDAEAGQQNRKEMNDQPRQLCAKEVKEHWNDDQEGKEPNDMALHPATEGNKPDLTNVAITNHGDGSDGKKDKERELKAFSSTTLTASKPLNPLETLEEKKDGGD